MTRGSALALAALLSSCSADRLALRATAEVLEKGRTASLEEPDYDLAREAAPAQLKLLETFAAADPSHRGLRRLAAEAFGGAAFLFFEDSAPERAKGLYRRGRDHALAALALQAPFRWLESLPQDRFEEALLAAGKADVPELFWAGFCWAGAVNLSKDDPGALAELPKAVALLQRAHRLDPSFQFAGADLFFGVYFASRPPLLGGDPRKAREHFDWARRITGGDYLMARYLEARWYAVAVQDRELFASLLGEVARGRPGRLPGARLADEAARRKAAALLERIDDYF